MNRLEPLLAAIAVAGCLAGTDALAITASGNATVQPAGPRTGNNGLAFLNIEGSSNGSFASFGVVDFMLPAAGPSAVSALSLALTESNAAFTRAGGLNFYVSTDHATSIANTGGSPLTFSSSALPDGLGSQLASTYLLGSGSFTHNGTGGNGTVDTYSFSLGGSAKSYVSGQYSSGGKLRLVVTPADATVAATFAGYTFGTPGYRPSLTFTASPVPEPTTVALWVAGLLTIVRLVHRRT